MSAFVDEAPQDRQVALRISAPRLHALRAGGDDDAPAGWFVRRGRRERASQRRAVAVRDFRDGEGDRWQPQRADFGTLDAADRDGRAEPARKNRPLSAGI